MTVLMTDAGPVAADAPVTRTGGVPLAPAGTDWPHCAACQGPMQFLAQIFLNDLGELDDLGEAEGRGALLLFMCQNDPGMCEEWSPSEGGNRAVLVPASGLRPMPLPEAAEEETILLGAVNAAAFERLATDYATAYEEWPERTGRSQRDILGRLGGEPCWLQGDETPDCPSCARPMRLIAELEEGPDHATGMNFGGGGCAYAFACEPCGQAAFLWQC